jgi:CheY-like chemotaxis protein
MASPFRNKQLLLCHSNGRPSGPRPDPTRLMIVPRTLDGRTAPYVLILEDLDAIANLLRAELSALGYRCFSLRSKGCAERFLNRVRPDLVIVDYGLLGGSGMKAAQMAAQSNVPVLVMSGYFGVRDEVERLGFC